MRTEACFLDEATRPSRCNQNTYNTLIIYTHFMCAHKHHKSAGCTALHVKTTTVVIGSENWNKEYEGCYASGCPALIRACTNVAVTSCSHAHAACAHAARESSTQVVRLV